MFLTETKVIIVQQIIFFQKALQMSLRHMLTNFIKRHWKKNSSVLIQIIAAVRFIEG